MSFFASLKKLFTKTKHRKENEKGVEMMSNIKPVYTRKVIGVSPKRQHRIMSSPPLRKNTIRRGRYPRGQLTPIKSISSSSSRRQSRSKSRSPLPPLQIPKSSSKSISKSRSKSRSKSISKSRSKSSSKSISKSRSKSKSPLPPLQIPNSSNSNNTRRKRHRGQIRNRHPNYEKHKTYRERLKTSPCRKIKPGAKCKLRTQCKYAMGNIRQFCRKRKNMSVRHYTG
ncbi:hypothetical protein [Yellowstone lake mimivirus]|uniref:hypothetical protein n=1 Tax=Yellowstone lake mimivirus TaxID=1586712 RepID=UPI0006EBAFE5|nr:hypothetical protein AR680_gp089 [Yellowstone lake mimivirus]BAT22013.1 hypothetical protein [Yellowstone lake mimivirus]